MNKIYQGGMIILVILMLTGCIAKRHDQQLVYVQEILSEAPDSALSLLNRIDPTVLSSSDRHLYDFLTIKANDKTYVTHCSDSLILDILDYYSSHTSEGLYPEALYYAGRVYSDLGDRPTALRYFQQALDRMPEKGKATQLNLKLRILSQTARLLTSLRLWDEAIPYLREVSTIEGQLNDTISTVQDLQLLGWTLMNNGKFDSAENVLKETLLYGNRIDSTLIAKSKVYLAATKYHRGENDSALIFIRNTYDQVNPLVRNNALSFGVSIYLQANKLDTAYLLAKELVESKDQLNKKIGYSALLSPELEAYVSSELQKQYITEYRNLLESFADESSIQLAVTQQALYNYQLHEREKLQAEQSNVKLWKVIFVISSIILLLGILLLYIKNRNKATIIRLQNALDSIRILNEELKIAAQHDEVEMQSEPTDMEEPIEEETVESASEDTPIEDEPSESESEDSIEEAPVEPKSESEDPVDEEPAETESESEEPVEEESAETESEAEEPVEEESVETEQVDEVIPEEEATETETETETESDTEEKPVETETEAEAVPEKQLAASDHKLEFPQKFDDEVTALNLRKRLLEELLALSNRNPSPTLAPEISSSSAYATLNHYIIAHKIFKYEDKFWAELEKVVLAVSPNFKRHLQLLTGQQLTELEYQTALLIKCHVKSKHMATITGRTKSAIGSRHNYLGFKIFGEDIQPKLLTKIIRNL